MIRVTIELDSAKTGATTKLGVMCIANDGSASIDRGNYEVAVLANACIDSVQKGKMPAPKHTLRRGRVEDYPRLSYNVWRLVLRALKSAFPEEK